MILPALALCILTPLALLTSIVGLWKSPSKWRTFLPIYIYVIFVGAYCYAPLQGSNVDLVRYFPEIEIYGRMTLAEAFLYNNDILYARDLLFWLCGHLHVIHLVPAITTSVVYSVAGYITCDVAERYDSRRYIGIILLFQFMMLPYVSIINNVRNVFGFSLIIIAAYFDIVKDKRPLWVWLFYAAGSLMHLSCFILIVFRILSRFSKKVFEIVLIVPFIFSSLVYLIYDYSYIFSFGGSFGNSIQTIIRKLYRYMTNTTTVYAIKAATSQTYIMNRMIMMVGVVLALILIYYGIRYKKSLFRDDLRFYAFAGMIAMMTLASNVFAVPNYWRFAAAFYIVIGIMLIPLLSNYRELPLLIKAITSLSLTLGPLGLFIQYWQMRGYDFKGWGISILFTDYITILFDIFKGIFTWG